MTQALYRRIDRPNFDVAPSTSLPAAPLPALAHLAQRLLFTRARGGDASHAATSLAELTAAGLTTPDCRDLLDRGLVLPLPLHPQAGTRGRGEGASSAPAREQQRHKHSSARSRNGRAVHSHSARRWSDEGLKSLNGKSVSVAAHHNLSHVGPLTRIFLTDSGLALVTRHAQSSFGVEPTSLPPSVSRSLLPRYDGEDRELIVAEVAILRLPAQARSLAAVLTALEQSGWRPRVGKPLSGRPGGNDPHHLAIAAYKLNARQSLIEFHADDGAFRWNWRQNVDRKVIER